MGCGASSSSEPPSREGSAGKSRTEHSENGDTKDTKQLMDSEEAKNGQIINKNLHLKEQSSNSGSQDSLNRKNKKNKSNKVDPLVPLGPGKYSSFS